MCFLAFDCDFNVVIEFLDFGLVAVDRYFKTGSVGYGRFLSVVRTC